jgi:hypothetical protein
MGNKFSSPLPQAGTSPSPLNSTTPLGDDTAKSNNRRMSDSTSKEINASSKLPKRSASDHPSTELRLASSEEKGMAPLSHANAAFLSRPSAYLTTTTTTEQIAVATTRSKSPLESIASHLLPSFQYTNTPAATRIISNVIFVTPCWHGEPTAGRPYEYTTTSLLIGRNGEDFASKGLFSVPKGVAGRLSHL